MKPKYVLFHPNPLLKGEILDPIITENILNAAKRGKITPQAEKLSLVPNKQGTYKDKEGKRFTGFKRVKKPECLPLKHLVLR